MRITTVSPPSNNLYYVLKDQLGSASVTTDATGTTVGEDRFYPFGETRITSGTMLTDKLFTGQRQVNLTGSSIYHYGARFYSPYINRFLSADTIVPGYANPQSLNRYSYGLNNPLRYTDPSGHVSCVGSNWDDGPQCLKNPNSTLSIVVANTKYQNECAAGKLKECPGGTKGGVAFFVAGVATAGVVDYAIAGGGAADLVEAGLSKAALACLQNAICRTLFGMVGGAGINSRGGETADTILGRQAHSNYPDMLGEPTYDYNRQIPGTKLRPDAIDWANNIVRELKPDNARAIQRGLTQLGKYVDALQELTGDTWTGILDIYPK